MPYLGTIGLVFEKALVISETNTLEFLKNESLTHTLNFDIGFNFSKVLGSGFSEGLGPGPLYKVCLFLQKKLRSRVVSESFLKDTAFLLETLSFLISRCIFRRTILTSNALSAFIKQNISKRWINQ